MNMNRRFYCVVGVASGLVLLGGGVAQAAATADEADRNIDPRATSGLPTDIFTRTEAQHHIAVSSGTGVGRADSMTPSIESSSRAELLPGLGGNIGADGLMGLLGTLPGGSVIGKLTGEGGPLGQLFGGGPLGSLLGAKKTPANNGQPGAANPNGPKTQRPAPGGDANGWHQGGPDGESPTGAMDMNAADPAWNGPAANPPRRPATANRPVAPHANDDTAAAPGGILGEGPTPGAGTDATGIPEKEQAPAGGIPLVGSIFGPEGPLGSVQILGGQTLKGVPIVGELLGGGLSLDKLSVPAISEVVNQIDDSDKSSPALGQLATVGKLGRMLLGGESATVPAEAAGARQSIDKTKVTPELLPLFGHDDLGAQDLGGIIYELPTAG